MPSAQGKIADTETIHFEQFPSAEEFTSALTKDDLASLGNWEKLIGVRDEVLKKLEVARRDKFIGQSLEAKLELTASGETAALLEQYRAMLPMLFITSQVSLNMVHGLPVAEPAEIAEGTPELAIRVQKADGTKCERCWNYSTHVGADKELPTLCERCAPVVRAISS
jgi:isoleucyl-tRNA synthetase